QLVKVRAQVIANDPCLLRKLVFFDHSNRRKRCRASNRVSAESRERQAGIFVGDLWNRGRATDGRAVGHAFREGHDLGLNIPVLDAAPAISRSSPTGLHFIADEDAAVAADDVGYNFEIILRWGNESADSHNRLSYERRDLPGGRSLDQLFDVSRAFHSARLRLQVERAAVTIWRVGMNEAGRN